ncbi:MAG: CpsD/CapB family tyrosine-protein kinase [Clostridia bacterium]|nr:CpsD/CapB family tyrosine-protein kinase [Clostridia bacterium]
MLINKIRNKCLQKKIEKKAEEKDISSNIIADDTHFSVLEAYKAARTNLMYTLTNEEGCKRVLFTSAMPSEGKSTTSINMAITFAQTGAKVLIIEADLRRPKLHKYLNLQNEFGISEYLGGFKDIREIVQKTEHNLDCITGGAIPPNPSELLMLPAMKELLDVFSKEYDYIFMDSPPINVVTDPVSLAPLMTGVVVVVKQNQTDSDSLRRAIASLEFSKARILGYFLNSSAELRGYTYNRYKYHYSSQYNFNYTYTYHYKGHYGYGHNHKAEETVKEKTV